MVLIFTALNYEWMPAILFIAYLLYGFFRPFLSPKRRREIEDEIGEDEDEEDEGAGDLPQQL
jgi:CDP-diacylglycerol--serine O-phosphatidyltransferase